MLHLYDDRHMKFPQKNISGNNNLQWIGYITAILLLSLILYFPVTTFGWITGLDQDLVIDNSMIYHLNSNNVLEMFLSATAGRYQPLTFLSYSLDIALAPGSVIKTMHIVNLILHLLNILLLFRIMQLLSKKQIIVVSATLLFAIHPMNVEAVAWISSRSQILCAFFFMAGLLAYIYYTRHETRKGLYFLCAAFFIMALLSNPVAVVFPLALLLIDYLQNRKLKDAIAAKSFFIAVSIIFILISVFTTESPDIMMADPGIGESVLLIVYSIPLVISKFFVPLGIAAFHPAPDQILLWLIALFLVVAILLASIFWYFRRDKTIVSGLFFFLGGIIATFLLSPGGHNLYSENETYLPYLGLFGLMGVVIFRLYTILRHRKILLLFFMLLTGAWILCSGLINSERLADWQNSGRVWTRVIELYPGDYYAFYLRGDYWAMNGEFDKAKFDYNQCICNNDHAYKAINNLGLIYLEEKAPRLALDEFSKAIEINGSFYKAYLNKGLTYMRIGRNDLAMGNMDKAIELNPEEPLAYYNRGLIYERKSSIEDAIAEFSKAIRLDPYRFIFYKDRGKAYIWMQKFPNAELDYSKAIELDPSDAEMWFRRSMARASMDNFEGALEDAFMAEKLGYPVPEDYIKGLTVQILKADSVIFE